MKFLLLFMLIQLHHILSFEANAKRNGVKRLKGLSLISHTFDRHFGISWDDCLQKCQDIRKCKSINYIRKTGFCEINDGDQITNPDALQTRMGSIFSSKHDWNFEEPEHCSSCSEGELCSSEQNKQCEIIGCPPPPPVAGATILGNLFNVGTKRLYRCNNGVQQVSVCQEDGSWSPVNITCSCSEIEIENAKYTITETEDGLIEATVVCDDGYFHYNANKIQCNSSTWKWDYLEQVRCVNIYAEPWTLVFRTTQAGRGHVVRLWRRATSLRTGGEFRNDEILDNWFNLSIKQVKIDIVNVSGNVAATLVFNGEGIGGHWFRRRRLINSSWTDLQTNVPVNVFSIYGLSNNKYNMEDYLNGLKWAILNYEITADNFVSIDCSKSVIWLTVLMAVYHPCDERLRKMGKQRLIIFSNSANGTTWEGGKLELAREMNVYAWLT